MFAKPKYQNMKQKNYSIVHGWEPPKGIPTLLLCVVALNTVLFYIISYGQNLGVGERIENGRRTYGTGTATIPMSAPPRPSDRYAWNSEYKNVKYERYILFFA
jgi:hypothetical protein